MLVFKLIVATLIILAAFVALYRIQKHIKGDGEALSFSSKKETRGSREELDAFIAAYQRDKAAKSTAQPQLAVATAQTPAAVAPPTSMPAHAALAQPSPIRASVNSTPPPQNWRSRPSFLETPSKLAYLLLKAGLPDHHVFANTRLSDLIETPADAPLGNLRVDLIVCTKELAIVAAIDVASNGAAQAPLQNDKTKCFDAAGIRYLRFATSAFPKPAEIRQLIYPQ